MNRVRAGVLTVTLTAFAGCASVLGLDGNPYVVGHDAGPWSTPANEDASGGPPVSMPPVPSDAGQEASPPECQHDASDPACEPCTRPCTWGACEAGPGSCELLARGQDMPRSIAVDDGGVYWLTSSAIMTCPLAGCPEAGPVALVSGLNEPAFLTLDETSVYWSTPGDLTVSACARAGCSDGGVTLAGGVAPGMLVRYQSSLLFTWTAANGGQLSGLRGCPIDDCEAGAVDLISFLSAQPDGLVVANPSFNPPVYTTATGNEDCVNWCADASPDGCNAGNWLTCPLISTVTGLAVDDGGVYARSKDGMVACPFNGPCPNGPFYAIPHGGSSPLVARGGRLYFGNAGDQIHSCATPACGAAPSVASVIIGDPSGIAVDDHFVYVTDRARGLVWKLALNL